MEVLHQPGRPYISGDDDDGLTPTAATATTTTTTTTIVSAAGVAAVVRTRGSRGGLEELGDFVDPHAKPSPDTVSRAASCARV